MRLNQPVRIRMDLYYQVRAMAEIEERPISVMMKILLLEAIAARAESKNQAVELLERL
jgi:hypothetical protein